MARGRKKRSRREEPRRDTRDRGAQEIDRLREENERLRQQLEEQAKRIADLERQLALNQQNSTITSKPPSSDGLGVDSGMRASRDEPTPCRRAAGPSGTPSGPGARGACGCDRRSRAGGVPSLRAPLARAAYHRRSSPASSDGVAADGRAHHRIPLPSSPVPRLYYLPRAAARRARESVWAAADGADGVLTVVCRMPRLVVQRFLEGALQIPISLGDDPERLGGNQCGGRGALCRTEAALAHERVLNVDETGHRTNGDKRWLWTFVAQTFVLYHIAASRGSDVLQRVLGETFAGILGSDRLPAYLKYVVGQRQFCWAHVTRNLLSALDLATTPAAKRFCREALALDRRLFRLWHRFRGDPGARGSPLTRAELIANVLPIAKRLWPSGSGISVRPTPTCAIWRMRSSCTISTSSPSCTRKASRPRTIPPRGRSARPFNGGRLCSGRGANRVNARSSIC